MSRAMDFIQWLRVANGAAVRITGRELVEQWRGSSDLLTSDEALRLALAIDASGFSFEPDVRFSGHILRPNDRVVIFSPAQATEPSTAYLAAAAIARLGIIIASSDGAVVPEEQRVVRDQVISAIQLDDPERRRLTAYLEWLLETPISLDAAEREAAGLSEDTRRRIGRFLVAVAKADARITTPETWVLSGSFALLGLTPRDLEAAVSTVAQDEEATARAVAVPEALTDLLAASISPTVVDRRALREARQLDEALETIFGPDPVSQDIADFENEFAGSWARIDADKRIRAGSLLALVPSRPRWQAFIKAWRSASLAYWLMHAREYPHAIAVLFGGFAFFEYEETSFWPQFARDLWALTEVQKTALRTAHERSISRLGLEMVRNVSSDRLTVGSAVHHIGVPLSLWADFLGVADHALRQSNWQSWTNDQWRADVTARCGPRVRLRNFLMTNEAAARETIAELGEIREFAIEDPTTTIEDLARVANVAFLRDEYFDDVPETAEFFRPDNLLSLFAGRYFLRYDDENSRLQVHLPRLEEPGDTVWRVGDHTQKARREPAWMTIDSAGFERRVDVQLESSSGTRTKTIAGVGDWGLYDQRREAFLDLDLRHATELRMGDYVLVSARPLTHMKRNGFLGEFPENQATTLEDGTRCFVTRLSPAALDGSLEIRWSTASGDLREHIVTFRTRLSTRTRTVTINGVERAMGDPSLPWYFLRPGPYPRINYASLPSVELKKMANQGSASSYARLKRYTEEGVIIPRPDGAWRLDREVARLSHANGSLVVSLLGLPSRMWALGADREPDVLEIVAEDGLTYLRATWPESHERAIREKLGRYGVAVVDA